MINPSDRPSLAARVPFEWIHWMDSAPLMTHRLTVDAATWQGPSLAATHQDSRVRRSSSPATPRSSGTRRCEARPDGNPASRS